MPAINCLARRSVSSLPKELEFEILGDPSAPISTRPWPLPSKEDIKRALADKSSNASREAKDKIDKEGNPLLRDTYTIIPFDSNEVDKELATIDTPKIHASHDEVFNTKDYPFITDFLASRMAALMDEPAFALYYGRAQPIIQLKKDWKKRLAANLNSTVAAEQKKEIDDAMQSYQAYQKQVSAVKKAQAELVAQVRHEAELMANRDLYAKSITEKYPDINPREQQILLELISDPLPARLLPIIEKQQALDDPLEKELDLYFKDLAVQKPKAQQQQ